MTKPNAHTRILSLNLFGIENVNNLGQLPPVGAKVYIMPIKIEEGSGAPIRLVGMWDDESESGTSQLRMTFFLTFVMMFASSFVL